MYYAFAVKTLALLFALCSAASAGPVAVSSTDESGSPAWLNDASAASKRDIELPNSGPSLVAERDLEKRRTQFWQITVHGKHACPSGYTYTRDQIYKTGLHPVGQFTGWSAISNAESVTLKDGGTLLSVAHSFTMSYGSTICCYRLGHNSIISGSGVFGYYPALSGGPTLYEVCVTAGAAGCSTVSPARACTASEITYNKGRV